MIDAIVIGSGPNGLAAAVTLARAGLEVELYEAQSSVGGGARTLDLGLAPGITHDICSAIHPMAAASPFFRQFDLAARGVKLVAPEISYAQPLDGGRAALAYRSLVTTVENLGPDGLAWARIFGPLLRNEAEIRDLTLHPLRPSPEIARAALGSPAGVRLGLRALRQTAARMIPAFRTPEAAALFTGVAAHAGAPLPRLVSSAVGLTLALLGHTSGWPIPVGGSQVITDALAADFTAHGGRIVTDHAISSAADLPPARAYLHATSPEHVGRLLAAQLPPRLGQKLSNYTRGSAVAKVDFVLNGPVPWVVPEVGKAATVHLGGSQEQVFAAEAAVARGRHAAHPVILLSDPTIADPGRSHNGLRPLWTYAHVPLGSTRDMTETVINEITRFAPEFRDTIIASANTPASQMAQENANYIGGDIGAGSLSLRRLLTGATGRWCPYALAVDGHYLCSAASPPGPAVHGMAGWNAARAVLRREFHLESPSLAPLNSR